MLIVNQLASFGAGGDGPRRPLIEILTDLGHDSNLLLCLDLADANCYPGSGQTVSDTSAAGNHFWLGSSSGAESRDPSFVGVAGRLSKNEYLLFDGTQYLTIQSSPAAFDAFHKDGATWTVLAVVWPIAGSGNQQLFTNITTTGAGTRLTINSNEQLQVQVLDNAQNNELLKAADNAMTAGQWNALAVSISENAGASGGFLWRNGAYDPSGSADQWNPAYPSPTTAAAGGAEHIGINADEGITGRFNNGTRLAAMVIWSVAKTKGQLDAIWVAVNGERGYR